MKRYILLFTFSLFASTSMLLCQEQVSQETSQQNKIESKVKETKAKQLKKGKFQKAKDSGKYLDGYENVKSVVVPNTKVGITYTSRTGALKYDLPIIVRDGEFAIMPFLLYGVVIDFLFKFKFFPQTAGYQGGVKFIQNEHTFTIGARNVGNELFINRSLKGYLDYTYNINTFTLQLALQVGDDCRFWQDARYFDNCDTNITSWIDMLVQLYVDPVNDITLKTMFNYTHNLEKNGGNALSAGLYIPMTLLSNVVNIIPFMEYGQGFGSLGDYFINMDRSTIHTLRSYEGANTETLDDDLEREFFNAGILGEFRYYFLRDIVPSASNFFLAGYIGGSVSLRKNYNKTKKNYKNYVTSLHGAIGVGAGFTLGRHAEIMYNLIYSGDKHKLIYTTFELRLDGAYLI